MGRMRLMADVLTSECEITTRPVEEGLTVRPAVGYDTNRGKTGISTHADLVNKSFEGSVKIEYSAEFGWGYHPWASNYARYHCRIGETDNWMGKEPAFMPAMCSACAYTGTAVKGATRILRLDHQPIERDGGDGCYPARKVGLMLIPYNNGSYTYVITYAMYQMTPESNVPNDYYGDANFHWRELNDDDIAISYSYSNEPSCDAVEMPDGSIVMAVLVPNDTPAEYHTVNIYKSYDGGENWRYISNFYPDFSDDVDRDEAALAIERIGTRIVVAVGANSDAAAAAAEKFMLFTYYSDDGGTTFDVDLGTNIYDSGDGKTDSAYDIPWVSMARSHSGRVYLFYCYYESGDTKTHGYYRYTDDGVNWSSEVEINETDNIQMHTVCACQTANGAWCIYYTDNDEINYMEYSGGTGELSDSAGVMTRFSDYTSGSDEITARTNDNTGTVSTAHTRWLDCDSFNDHGFVDVAASMMDAAPATDYYGSYVMRCAMWNGIPFYEADEYSAPEHERIYFPWIHPSTSDNEPNIDAWSRSSGGSWSKTLTYDTGDGKHRYLQMTADDTSTDYIYYYKSPLSTSSYDNGIAVRFCVKVESGEAKVQVVLSDGSQYTSVSVRIYENQSIPVRSYFALYDHASGGSVIDSHLHNLLGITVDEWYTFVYVQHETTCRLYHAETNVHGEVISLELVCEGECDTTAGAGTPRIYWGIRCNNASPDTYTNVDIGWRYMSYREGVSDQLYDWNFYTDPDGGACDTQNPQGFVSGVGVRFSGLNVYENDQWDVFTGAHFEAENILHGSPSVQWCGPQNVPDADHDEQGITFKLPLDSYGSRPEFVYDSFAFFGKNFLFFRVDDDTGAVINSETVGGVQMPFARELKLEDTGPSGNVVPLASPADDAYGLTEMYRGGPMELIPNQYASDGVRNWYVMFDSGADTGVANKVFKIIGNDTHQLFLDQNVEILGAAADDDLYLFSDRLFYDIGSDRATKEIEITIYSQKIAMGEKSLKIGRFLIGKVQRYLNDANWEWSMDHVGHTNRISSPAGITHLNRSLVCSKRTVTLRYTGQVDRQMGKTEIAQLHEATGYGKHPVVWIDDDRVMDNMTNGASNSTDEYYHHDPLLAMVAPSFNQEVKVPYYKGNGDALLVGYNGATDYSSYYPMLNLIDVELKLEEIL